MSKFSRVFLVFFVLFALSACGGGGGGGESNIKILDSRAIVVRYGGVTRKNGERVQDYDARDEAGDVDFRTEEKRSSSPNPISKRGSSDRTVSAKFTADAGGAGSFETEGHLPRKPGNDSVFSSARIYEDADGDPFLSVAVESENAWFGIAAKNYRYSPVMTLAAFYGGKDATDLPASARYGGVATGYMVATGAASPEGNGLYAARGAVEIIADFNAGSVQGKLSDLHVQDLADPSVIVPAGFEITADGAMNGTRYLAQTGTVTMTSPQTANQTLALQSVRMEGGVFGKGGKETAGALSFSVQNRAGRDISGVLGFHAQ